MAWATVEDVADVTDKTVPLGTVNAAEQVISTVVGRPTDADIRRPRDLANLRLAVCWQAAYMATNDDLLERADVQQESIGHSDLQTINRPDGLSVVLAPLARMAINRLSWMRPRARRVLSPVERFLVKREELDDLERWTPLR